MIFSNPARATTPGLLVLLACDTLSLLQVTCPITTTMLFVDHVKNIPVLWLQRLQRTQVTGTILCLWNIYAKRRRY